MINVTRRHVSVVLATALIAASLVAVGLWIASLDATKSGIPGAMLVKAAIIIGLLAAGAVLLFFEFEDSVRERTRALEQAKAKDEALLSSIGDGVFATDSHGKIIFINDVALKKFLWDPKDEILGREATKIFRLEDEAGKEVSGDARPLNKVLLSKSRHSAPISSTGSYYYVRSDHSRFPTAITVSPVLVEGRAIGAIEVFRDITKEKEIDRAKTEFVSLASHQLRTPLSTINWYAEMLLAGDAGKISKEQRKYVDEIYRGNQRMVALVGDLLNVSRIEVGSFTVDPEPTNILELADQIVTDLEPRIFKRKLGLEEHYDKDIPVMNIDPKLTGIVIDNLLSNAVKYTPIGGHIDFSIQKKTSNSLLISVKDNGYGIPEAQKGRIFSKLFRADNVLNKETDGTGLGLYITKAIVEYSGGKIWFDSIENQGTTFYVSLPLAGMAKKAGSKSIDEAYHPAAKGSGL